MNKRHLFFRNPEEGLVQYRSRPGGGSGKDDDDVIEKDYTFLVEHYSECQERFYADSETRRLNRTLGTPDHFDLIELTFFGSFDQPKFEAYYIDHFGLTLLHIGAFNRKGLFAIIDQDKFDYLMQEIQIFIENIINERSPNYNGKIKFIKSFKLFSSRDMFGNIDNYGAIHLNLFDSAVIDQSHILPQREYFETFLSERNIDSKISQNQAEIYDINEVLLREILNNFDFIHASCSGSGAIIQPDQYNTPRREYGFQITNGNDNIPIIGVVDTGVSNHTPLSDLLVGENGEFDTTNTGSFIDNADHGTGVAAFAALGNKLIPDFQGNIEADAKILPIKILDASQGAISQQQTIDLIRQAHIEYAVKIFTLTIGYTNYPLSDNQEFSSYARMLDELTSELDILIFISTTNNIIPVNNPDEYPARFAEDQANIAPPSESMNNLTIGASANNFEDNDIQGLATFKDFPGLYSRKFHYNYEDKDYFNTQTGNPYLRKPDVLMPGGDYEEYFILGQPGYEDRGDRCLQVLSSDLHERVLRRLGTSYSAPLAANLAAKLLQLYPTLDMQSVKALIINSSNEVKLGDTFNQFSNTMIRRIQGYGIIDESKLLHSNDERVTFVIEDEAYPGQIKVFPLHLPEYLNEAGRKNGLLKINITLCFKFSPKHNNQLIYCPLHVSYAIGKNLPLEQSHIEMKKDDNGNYKKVETQDGYNGSSSKNIKLNSTSKGWAQDYYYKGKIVSNVQKTSLNVSRDRIIAEDNTIKIAINAAFHKMLSEADKEPYNQAIPYSIAVSIEQVPLKDENLNSLYDELYAINNLEVITDLELEAEL